MASSSVLSYLSVSSREKRLITSGRFTGRSPSLHGSWRTSSCIFAKCSGQRTTILEVGASPTTSRITPEEVFSVVVEVSGSKTPTLVRVSLESSRTNIDLLGFGSSAFGQPAQQQQPQSTGMFGNTTTTFGGGGGFGQNNAASTQNTGFGARPGFGSTGTSTFGASSE